MGYNGHNQNEHDMSSITLVNGLASYAYMPLSATSSSFGPLSHMYADNGHPSPQVAAGTVPIPKEARQLTNWFQPILWTLIDETAEKVCIQFVFPRELNSRIAPVRIRQSAPHRPTPPRNRFSAHLWSTRRTSSTQVDQRGENGMEDVCIGESEEAGIAGACSSGVDYCSDGEWYGQRQ